MISASFVAFDCLAAIFAADLIILFFVISVQNPRISAGNPALRLYCFGMLFHFFSENTCIVKCKTT